MRQFCFILTVLVFTSCMTQQPNETTQKQRTSDILQHVSQELSGTEWQVVRVLEQDVIEPAELTLLFDNNGNISGLAGCNQYGGKFNRNLQDLSFSELLSTRKMCFGEELMNLEADFLASLGKVNTFHITPNGTLVLFLPEEQGTIVANRMSVE